MNVDNPYRTALDPETAEIGQAEFHLSSGKVISFCTVGRPRYEQGCWTISYAPFERKRLVQFQNESILMVTYTVMP